MNEPINHDDLENLARVIAGLEPNDRAIFDEALFREDRANDPTDYDLASFIGKVRARVPRPAT